ncbi:MAG: efflux RND transporter periplasmic adaptor subunit, partial [Pirellula sp.]
EIVVWALLWSARKKTTSSSDQLMTQPDQNSLKSWFVGLGLPIAIVGLGVWIYLALGTQKPKQVNQDAANPRVVLSKLPIISVDSVKAFEGIPTLDINLSGTVVPFRQINLAAEVAGKVIYKSEECRIGRYVHEGDVLFRIDPTDYNLDVERLTALRESEYAQQHELDQELSNANRSLALAQEELTLLDKEVARIETLPEGFASGTEKDQAKRQRLMSENQVVTIQNQLRLLETRRARLELAERLAETQLNQAKINLERSEIKAPVSGVIVNETVQKDSYVQKASLLCVIEDTERVEVTCNLRTDQLLLVLDQLDSKDGSSSSSRIMRSSSYELPKTPVEISYHVSGREDIVYQWRGHLSRYEGIGLDPQSRTVPVRITVDNPRDVRRNGELIAEDGNGGLPALVRGMFVDVAIKTIPKQALILLPKLALKPGGQIWKFENDPSILAQSSASNAEANALDAALNLPKLGDWEAGRVKILGGIRTISLIRVPALGDEEYWVTEAKNDLKADEQLIVSPLSNIIGDGNDKVRMALKKHSSGESSK